MGAKTRHQRPWARKRVLVQIGAMVAMNSYFLSFLKFCPTPALNCYACPLATTACPIGSFQYFLAIRRVPFALLGFVTAIGALVGRATCGWACPFGFIQDLLARLRPDPKRKLVRRMGPGWVRYFVLVGLVGAGAFIVRSPIFCKLCPAGTLEAGIPLALTKPYVRDLIGPLYWAKLGILAALVAAAVLIKRPFCRFICPLGAAYSPFNRLSRMRLSVDHTRCTNCGLCRNLCPVELEVHKDPDSDACIRCLECTRCPAVSVGWGKGPAWASKAAGDVAAKLSRNS